MGNKKMENLKKWRFELHNEGRLDHQSDLLCHHCHSPSTPSPSSTSSKYSTSIWENKNNNNNLLTTTSSSQYSTNPENQNWKMKNNNKQIQKMSTLPLATHTIANSTSLQDLTNSEFFQSFLSNFISPSRISLSSEKDMRYVFSQLEIFIS